MVAADIEAAQALAAEVFADLDRRQGRERRRHPPFPGRYERLLATDPDGMWVATDDEGIVGVAAGFRRASVWVLSMLAVRFTAQERGIGRALLEASLRIAEGAASCLIVSSTDPRAIRAYARAGFALRPTLSGVGTPRAIDQPGGTRVGSASDLDLTEVVDRRVRGAARAGDLATVLDAGGRLILADGSDGAGYAITRHGDLFVLAATDEPTAVRLLARVLAEADGPMQVRWLDAAQNWAIPLVLDAGLALYPTGPICVRGRPAPLTPFIPSGAFV
jgi:GNAT superfamily N-acetyltransferase